MKKFLRDLKKSGGHILSTIKLHNGKTLIYYREYGSFPTDVKIKTF